MLDFVKEHSSVLESKASEPKIIRKKYELWEALSEKFAAHGYNRGSKDIKLAYIRMKSSAKKAIARHRRELKKTGGGTAEDKAPTEMDWTIVDISPLDFEEDEAELDSDSFRVSFLQPESYLLLEVYPLKTSLTNSLFADYIKASSTRGI